MNFSDFIQASSTQAGFLDNPGFTAFFMLLIIWDLVWRGVALWKSAGNKSKPWFIALLILNTVGILPIIYIFFFADKKAKEIPPQQ